MLVLQTFIFISFHIFVKSGLFYCLFTVQEFLCCRYSVLSVRRSKSGLASTEYLQHINLYYILCLHLHFIYVCLFIFSYIILYVSVCVCIVPHFV